MSRRALILNSASGAALLIVTVIVSFIMSPFLVRQLGNANYGFWELILGLVGYLGVLDLGVGPAVIRYVALAHGSGDQATLSRVVNAGFASFLLAGLVGAVIVLAAAVRPQWLFGDVPLDLLEARSAIALGALIFLLTFCRSTFSATLMGLQLHRVVNITRIANAIIAAVVVRITLPATQPHALIALAGIVASATFIEMALFAVVLLGHVDRRLINPARVSWVDIRSLLGFGAKSVGLMASGSMMRQGILFVISHTIGAAAVTFYVLAGRLVEYTQQLAQAIGFPMTSYLASAFGSGGLDGARQAWLSTTRALQFVQAGLAMGLVWLGLPFLARWMGPEYAQKGALVFYLLSAALFVGLFGTNANRMLVSVNQHGRVAIAAIGLAAFCILLAVVGSMRFGLAGAAGAARYFPPASALWN